MHAPPRRTLTAAALATLLLSLPVEARAQSWSDGSTSMQAHFCTLPVMGSLYEQLAWTFVGQSTPAVAGQVYWMHIWIGSLGCSGIYAVPEVRLPPNTSFAIDATHPITCIYKNTQDVYTTLTTSDCPTAPKASLYATGFSNLGHPAAYLYALAAGTSLEIRFPVISTAPLSGMATNDFLMGAVQISDLNTGNIFWDAPVMPYVGGLPNGGPYQGIFVQASGAAARPTIRYVEPTLLSVSETTAVTAAQISTAGCGATVYYELYPADGSTDTTYFVPGTSSCAWNASAPFQCALGWGGLIGGKNYKWRVYDWVPNAGQPSSCARSNVIGLPSDWTLGVNAVEGWHYFTAPSPTKPTLHSLVTTAPNGAVTLSPTGGAYAPGTVVTATATPDAGFAFDGWLLDGVSAGTANPISVTMNAAHTLEAQFTPTYVISSSVTGSGSIAFSPAQTSWKAGTVVSATATPTAGNVFVGWTLDGAAAGSANPLSVTMNGNHVLAATFAVQPAGTFVVTVATSGTGTGTVTLSPPGGSYASGTTVTATATPIGDSSFTTWRKNGVDQGSANPLSFTVTANTALTAEFTAGAGRPPAPIGVGADGGGCTTADGAGLLALLLGSLAVGGRRRRAQAPAGLRRRR